VVWGCRPFDSRRRKCVNFLRECLDALERVVYLTIFEVHENGHARRPGLCVGRRISAVFAEPLVGIDRRCRRRCDGHVGTDGDDDCAGGGTGSGDCNGESEGQGWGKVEGTSDGTKTRLVEGRR